MLYTVDRRTKQTGKTVFRRPGSRSLRNFGRAEESVALLTAEIEAGTDDLDGAVLAFLALALAGTGRDREGLSVALAALAPHLPRYQRAVAAYAGLLTEPEAAT